MKKTILLLVIAIIMLSGVEASAQTFPYGINYQAVARDANGNPPPVNTSEPLRFTIYKTSATGAVVWQEIQNALTTNSMGQFSAIIGAGQPQVPFVAASFSQINWSNDSYFLKVELQTGISTFVQIGVTTQFQSVPYALSSPDPTPAGVISAFGGINAPAGYLMCRGQAVARPVGGVGVYAKLYAAIGTAYGNGDGSTTFNVPDFRGMFLRGVDSTAINDPNASSRIAVNGGNSGAMLGSKQVDDFKSHTHILPGGLRTNYPNGAGTIFGLDLGLTTHDESTFPTGGSETRPKNIYVNYIIKY